MSDHVDVLIIGAGLSGIGAAAHLAKDLPATSYAVLERREASGGTWDLFRYPGVRSDSDMFTLGYRFRPWRGTTALADGASILRYVRDTARAYDVDRHIRYGHHVTSAAWDSDTARWTVTAEVDGEPRQVTADFLWACSGYYDYDQGYTPHFEGQERFAGRVVFVEDYDINVGRHLVQGVDVWLNTPRRPLEASGTSGMKVVLNGGLNLSVPDGWWAEAYDGGNGFAVGRGETHSVAEVQDRRDAEDLYRALEE